MVDLELIVFKVNHMITGQPWAQPPLFYYFPYLQFAAEL